MERSKKLFVDEQFTPTSIEDGDEIFPNGIFEFNITKLLSFIQQNKNLVERELIRVKSYRGFSSDHLDETIIESADLSSPVILAEIAPGRYNLIDGHHRVEKAFRHKVENLPAFKVAVSQHIPFFTSKNAYLAFVEYWNSKLRDE